MSLAQHLRYCFDLAVFRHLKAHQAWLIFFYQAGLFTLLVAVFLWTLQAFAEITLSNLASLVHAQCLDLAPRHLEVCLATTHQLQQFGEDSQREH